MDDKNSTWCTVIDSNPLGQNNRPRPVWSKPHPIYPLYKHRKQVPKISRAAGISMAIWKE